MSVLRTDCARAIMALGLGAVGTGGFTRRTGARGGGEGSKEMVVGLSGGKGGSARSTPRNAALDGVGVGEPEPKVKWVTDVSGVNISSSSSLSLPRDESVDGARAVSGAEIVHDGLATGEVWRARKRLEMASTLTRCACESDTAGDSLVEGWRLKDGTGMLCD